MKPTREDALAAIRTLISFIGDDPSRPGLLDTPQRVLAAWLEDWGAGYFERDFAVTLFDNDVAYDQMIFMKDISFFSTCEHHLAPFFGTAAIAYIPKGHIVGLSKLPRIVQHFSARLQVQERLVREIADFIVKNISPDCAVSLEATHLCMVSRGIRQPTAKTITTALRGFFRDDPATQDEFITQVRSR